MSNDIKDHIMMIVWESQNHLNSLAILHLLFRFSYTGGYLCFIHINTCRWRHNKATYAGSTAQAYSTCIKEGLAGRESVQEERTRKEGGWEKAGVSIQHAPGISYLKCGDCAPLKPLHGANKDADLRQDEAAQQGHRVKHILMRGRR